MKHQTGSGSTARMVHAAKQLVAHGTKTMIVCNDKTHLDVMRTNHPEIPGLTYGLWQQIPDESYRTMEYSGHRLFFDHYTIEQRLAPLIQHYEAFAERKSFEQ
jgi:hypothetical protein